MASRIHRNNEQQIKTNSRITYQQKKTLMKHWKNNLTGLIFVLSTTVILAHDEPSTWTF